MGRSSATTRPSAGGAGRTILLVVGGANQGAEVLYALGRTHQRAWVLPLSADAARLARSRWCRGIARRPGGDPEDDLRPAIAQAIRSTGATHVIPSTVEAAMTVSDMGDSLGPARPYPSPSAAMLRRLDDKAKFSALARAIGLPVVDSVIAHDEESARAHGLEYPVVLKPVDCSGGIGIRYCAAKEELDTALADWARYPQLVERYVPGSDVHLTFLSSEGEIVAWEAHEPHPCGAIGYAACRFYRDDRAIEVARELARALAYTGMANLDFRRDDTGALVLLECNPRLYRRIGLAAKAGVNFIEIGLDLADGAPLGGTPVSPGDRVVCSPTVLPALLRQRHLHGLGRSAIADAVGFVSSDPLLVAAHLARNLTRSLRRINRRHAATGR